jgi:hypothetical protein
MAIGSHTIPRFYLEQFAAIKRVGKPGRVWVYEKDRAVRLASTKAQGYENGYFRYTHPDGRQDESFETTLATIENQCNDILVCARNIAFDLGSSSHRNTLAQYVAVLFARSTTRRTFSAGNWEKIKKPFSQLAQSEGYVRDLAAHYTERTGEVFTEQMARDVLEQVAETFSRKDTVDNAFVTDLLEHAQAAKSDFIRKPWQVWLAPDGSEFVTSDNPVVTFIKFGDTWNPGHGFRRPGVIVVFPLAPSACLIMGETGIVAPGKEYQQIDSDTVVKLNELVISCSDRFVYSRTKSNRTSETVNRLSHLVVPGVNAFMGQMPGTDKIEDHLRNTLGIRKRRVG